MITHGQARRIASEWHGGGGSALYMFASSGAIIPNDIRTELQSCLYVNERDYPNALELRELLRYAYEYGPRKPQDGWHLLWDETPVTLEDV